MGVFNQLMPADDVVEGDTIRWLEYPPYRWAEGLVIGVKVRMAESEDSITIRCTQAEENLPQLEVGEVARRKMQRLRMAKLHRYNWLNEDARAVELRKQIRKRNKSIGAAMRARYKKERM